MDEFRSFLWWLFAPYKEYFYPPCCIFILLFSWSLEPSMQWKKSLALSPLRGALVSALESVISCFGEQSWPQASVATRTEQKKWDPWLTAQLWPWSPHLQPVSTAWIWSTFVRSLRNRAVHYFTIYQWRTVDFSGLASLRKWKNYHYHTIFKNIYFYSLSLLSLSRRQMSRTTILLLKII